MIVSAVFCWGVAELNVDMTKVPLLGLEFLGEVPRGTIFALILGFYCYCLLAFCIRYVNELKYSEEFAEDLNLMDDQLMAARAKLMGLDPRGAAINVKWDGDEARQRNREHAEIARHSMLQAAEAIADVRSFISNVKSLLAIERVVLAFWVPVSSSVFLVLISIRSNWDALATGVAYFATKLLGLF